MRIVFLGSGLLLGLLSLPYGIKLGVALQVTNILRDVAEDWQMGRVYLPQAELAG